jgi:hypothetical protein
VVTTSALILLIAGIVTAGLPLYVFPPPGDTGSADLIYIIGPPTPARVDVERSLREQGVADLTLVSTSLIGGYTAEKYGICQRSNVVCEHPEPYTTKGEAALLGRFAAEHGVERTIVLTFTPHVARTRYIFAKCSAGEVSVVAVDQHLDLAEWIYQFAYQTVAFAKAWLTPCADASDL